MITIDENVSIGPDELRKQIITQGQALLLKTENAAIGKCIAGLFDINYVFLTAEGVKVPLPKLRPWNST